MALQPDLISDQKTDVPAAPTPLAKQSSKPAPKSPPVEKASTEIESEISATDTQIESAEGEVARLREARGDALARGADDKEVDKRDGEIRLASRNLERLRVCRAGLEQDIAQARECERLAAAKAAHDDAKRMQRVGVEKIKRYAKMATEMRGIMLDLYCIDRRLADLSHDYMGEDGFGLVWSPNVIMRRKETETIFGGEHTVEKWPSQYHVNTSGVKVDSRGVPIRPTYETVKVPDRIEPGHTNPELYSAVVLPTGDAYPVSIFDGHALQRFKMSDEYGERLRALVADAAEGNQ